MQNMVRITLSLGLLSLLLATALAQQPIPTPTPTPQRQPPGVQATPTLGFGYCALWRCFMDKSLGDMRSLLTFCSVEPPCFLHTWLTSCVMLSAASRPQFQAPLAMPLSAAVALPGIYPFLSVPIRSICVVCVEPLPPLCPSRPLRLHLGFLAKG